MQWEFGIHFISNYALAKLYLNPFISLLRSHSGVYKITL
jgi:hypothetical protein